MVPLFSLGSSSQIRQITDSQMNSSPPNEGGVPEGRIRATEQNLMFSQTQNLGLGVSNPQSSTLLSQMPSTFGSSFYAFGLGGGGGGQGGLTGNSGNSNPRGPPAFTKGTGMTRRIEGNSEFKMPLAPLQQKRRKYWREFTDSNMFMSTSQITGAQRTSESTLIRYLPQGSTSRKVQNMEEMAKKKQERWMVRQAEERRNQIEMYREYRTGEMPDIQIMYKDVFLPLMGLCRLDPSIAANLFLKTFVELYKNESREPLKAQLLDSVETILDKSESSSFQVVHTIHRILLQITKQSGYIPRCTGMATTAIKSLSFQTSLLTLEEALLQQTPYESKRGMSIKHNQINPLSYINSGNKHIWLQLAQIYSHMGEKDTAQGIWELISENTQVFMHTHGPTSLLVESNIQILTKCRELRDSGKLGDCAREIELGLSDPHIHNNMDKELISHLSKERLSALSYLGEWKELANTIGSIEGANGDPALIAYYLRSGIRCDQLWNSLSSQIETQLLGPARNLITDGFSFELGLMNLIQKDLDRGIFYVSKLFHQFIHKWSDIDKLSISAKHLLVQNIQKLHEFNEFIKIMKQENILQKEEIIKLTVGLMKTWKARYPSAYYDDLSVWEDILYARHLYIVILSGKFEGLIDGLNSVSETKDILANFHTQTALGAYKKRMYDSSDRYLKLALKYRSKDTRNNLGITFPIIKLKAKQNEIESLGVTFEEKTKRIKKIIDVLESEKGKMDADVVMKDDEINYLLLRCKLGTQMSETIQTYIEGENSEYRMSHVQTLAKSFKLAYAAVSSANSKTQEIFFQENPRLKYKTHYKYAKFCDNVLRKEELMEDEPKSTNYMASALGEADIEVNVLARILMENGLAAINGGNIPARDLIPRLLDILTRYNPSVSSIFKSKSNCTPCWLFLKWMSQVISLVNTPISEDITSKLLEIITLYPQPVFYTYKVQSSTEECGIEASSPPTPLHTLISQIFNNYGLLQSFTESLECLIHPEHRFKHWTEILKEAYPTTTNNWDNMSRLVTLMIKDLLGISKEYVGKLIGKYNRQFAQGWEKHFLKFFGKTGEGIRGKKLDEYARDLANIMKKIEESLRGGRGGTGSDGIHKLALFSEWMDQYAAVDFYDSHNYIEIPGQYEGNIQPNPQRHIKVNYIYIYIYI